MDCGKVLKPSFVLLLSLVALGCSGSPDSSAQNSISFSAVAGTLSISPPTANVLQGGTEAFSLTGGSGAYTFSIFSGASYGSIDSDSGLFIAAENGSGVVVVEGVDSGGDAPVFALVTVNGAPVMTEFSISETGCVGGSASMGEVQNSSALSSQFFCAQFQSGAAATASMITDIQMTPEGTHETGGIPCGTGYIAVGTIADCGGGSCSGDQNFCMKSGPIGSATQLVLGVYITPEGQHLSGGPGCATGYTSIGMSADCGGENCQGDQNFCVQVIQL